jgi:vitamin B12/bleomycin/antimicrobial peptide transport system ATP-binding/permease protein
VLRQWARLAGQHMRTTLVSQGSRMMEIVTGELPKATIVSVAHRVELEAFHSRKIVLERRKGGAKLVSDVNLIPRKGKRRLLGRFLRQRKTLQNKAPQNKAA